MIGLVLMVLAMQNIWNEPSMWMASFAACMTNPGGHSGVNCRARFNTDGGENNDVSLWDFANFQRTPTRDRRF